MTKVIITIETILNEEQAEYFQKQNKELLTIGDELAQAETIKDILRNPTDKDVKLNWKTKQSFFHALFRKTKSQDLLINSSKK